MNIAFLFNAQHKSFGSLYGDAVLNMILNTNVLQENPQHMRICVGDILTHMMVARSKNPNFENLTKICVLIDPPKSVL